MYRATIGVGHESGGSYHSTASLELAHQRLNNPSLGNLCLLVPSLSTVTSLQCESCKLGKHIHHTYNPHINKHVVSPFALVNSNIQGPSQVCPTLGYFYFVTFIDDFFRCT